LGKAGWYRRFIRNFAEISALLTDTLKKSGKFHLTPAAQQAIETLKTALVTAPVLNRQDFSRRFYIQCDASDTGVGAVVFQLDDQGTTDPLNTSHRS